MMSAVLNQVLPGLTLATAAVVVVTVTVVFHRHGAPRRAGEFAIIGRAAGAEEDFRVAAGQLEAEDVVSRLLAVRALEDLAQAHPGYRLAVVDLMCAYLRRTPCVRDEAVRRAAQNALTSHLVPASRARYWGPVDVDLTGAVLADLDLSGAEIGTLTCQHALFQGETSLRGACIRGAATFTGASFMGSVRSGNVDFLQMADFTATRWCAEASFDGCAFRGSTFAGASFAGSVSFAEVVFLARTNFSHPIEGPACFQGFVDLRGACFSDARFAGVDFPAGVDLRDTDFTRPVPQEGAHPALRAASQR